MSLVAWGAQEADVSSARAATREARARLNDRPLGWSSLGRRPPRDLDVVIPLDEPTVGSKAVAPCPAGGLHDERLFTRPLHLWFFLARGAAARACAVDEVSGAPLRGLQSKEAPPASH